MSWWWQNTYFYYVAKNQIDSCEHLHFGQEATQPASPVAVANTEHLLSSENVTSDVYIQNAEHIHVAQTAPAIAHNASFSHLHYAQNVGFIIEVQDSVHLHNASVVVSGKVSVDYTEHRHLAKMAEISNFFRFATQYGTPDVITDYPITYVELSRTENLLSPAAPSSGVYLEVVENQAAISQETSESVFGIRTLADTEILINNKDKIFKGDGGVEIRGFHAQVWERQNGVNRRLYKGKVAGLNIDSITRIRLRDAVRTAFDSSLPKRFITTTQFPKAKDVGKPISIATGRVSRLPCYNIEWDDANRRYRYSCGEGIGYTGASWWQIYSAYHSDIVFKVTTGVVVSGTTTSIRLEAADKRPADYYKWQWAIINNSPTPRYITTSDADTDIFFTPSISPAPAAGQPYEIKPYWFYNGSQSSPYPGIALVDFKIPILDGNELEQVYVDADALQIEKNYVRMIQSLLSNTVWGMGLDVDVTAFDTAAALADITPLLCEYQINEPEKLIDLITDLAQVRGIWLYDN